MEAYDLPKKDASYNLKYKDEARIAQTKMFNAETSMINQPDIVSKNSDFFSSLMICGVQPVGYCAYPVFSPHQRRFNVLAGLPMIHKPYNLPITKMEVPEVGYQEPHKNMFSDLMTYLGGGRVAGKGNHLAIRARPHLLGVDCVVFNCCVEGGYLTFMWDEANVFSVQSTHPCVFSKAGGEYTLVSDVPDSFFSSVKYKKVEWELLSEDLLERSPNGIIIDVDTTQYLVPIEVCVVLRSKLLERREIDVVIRQDKDANVLMDSTGTQYGLTNIPDGLYDVNIHTLEPVRERLDRVYPDSKQMVSVTKDKTVSAKELVGYVCLYEDKQVFPGIKVALDTLKNLCYQSNVNRSVVAPELTQRQKIQFVHRKDLVREYLAQCAVDKCIELDYPSLWQTFYNKGVYIKDGMLHKMYYQPIELFFADNLSSAPRPGYACALLTSFDHNCRMYFSYRGAYLVYYDYYKWEYNEVTRKLNAIVVHNELVQ